MRTRLFPYEYPLVLTLVLSSHHSRMSSIVSGPVHFAQIPDELWNHPPWLNWTMALERMEQMENDGIAKSGRIGSGFRPSFLKLVLTMSIRLGITTCADSTLGSDPISFSHTDRPD